MKSAVLMRWLLGLLILNLSKNQIYIDREGDDASGFRHPITASGSLLSHIAWLVSLSGSMRMHVDG